MKTITIITLIFLPPTFVAVRQMNLRLLLVAYEPLMVEQVIFSMSMFNWQADGSNGDQIMSKYIWVYFVVTVPLTMIVLLVWIMWVKWSGKKQKERWAEYRV
jgi:hypothetical protein